MPGSVPIAYTATTLASLLEARLGCANGRELLKKHQRLGVAPVGAPFPAGAVDGYLRRAEALDATPANASIERRRAVQRACFDVIADVRDHGFGDVTPQQFVRAATRAMECDRVSKARRRGEVDSSLGDVLADSLRKAWTGGTTQDSLREDWKGRRTQEQRSLEAGFRALACGIQAGGVSLYPPDAESLLACLALPESFAAEQVTKDFKAADSLHRAFGFGTAGSDDRPDPGAVSAAQLLPVLVVFGYMHADSELTRLDKAGVTRRVDQVRSVIAVLRLTARTLELDVSDEEWTWLMLAGLGLAPLVDHLLVSGDMSVGRPDRWRQLEAAALKLANADWPAVAAASPPAKAA